MLDDRPLRSDSAVITNSSLFAFTRNVTTTAWDGSEVSANTPRFGPPQAVAGLAGEIVDLVQDGVGVITATSRPAVYAGLDEGGLAMIAVFDESSGTPRLRVFRETASNAWTAVSSVKQPSRVIYQTTPTTETIDDLRGLAGQTGDDSTCFVRRAMLIVHGTMIALCDGWKKSGSSWIGAESKGVGLLTSTDRGVTWSASYDDTGANRNPGRSRGQVWALNHYYTPFFDVSQPELALLEIWIAFGDYQHAPGGNTIRPNGGVAYWTKLTREEDGVPFEPEMDGGSIRVGRYATTPDDFSFQSGSGNWYWHMHQVALARQGNDDKLVAITGEGDTPVSIIRRIYNIDRRDS